MQVDDILAEIRRLAKVDPPSGASPPPEPSQRTATMAELREPIYLEEKLKEIQGTGRLSYRSKALPTWCPGCGYFSMTEGVAQRAQPARHRATRTW